MDAYPRASLADSLCPGLLSFGLSALANSCDGEVQYDRLDKRERCGGGAGQKRKGRASKPGPFAHIRTAKTLLQAQEPAGHQFWGQMGNSTNCTFGLDATLSELMDRSVVNPG